MSKENNPCRHPVMRIPGVIFESVYIDTLHVLDLGVSLHCAANLFVDIVHELPGSRQSNLVTLRQDVMSLYGKFRTPVDCRGPTLELKHFLPNTTSYPELHCEVRCLVPVCKALANNVQPSQVDLRCHGCAPVAFVCRIIPGWQSMLHRRGVYNGA